MTGHNRERGTVTIEADGQTYRLVMDLNALVMIEGHFSTPERAITMLDIARNVHMGNGTYTQMFLWAAFQEHHPGVTPVEAARLVWANGVDGYVQVRDALIASITPDRADQEAVNADAGPRPRTAPPGAAKASRRMTGGASTSEPAVVG
jgi:hypothetical protein